MGTAYKFDIVASTGSGFDELGNSPSINDAGEVAFVGKKGTTESIYVDSGSASPKDITPGGSSVIDFHPSVQINNASQVVGRFLKTDSGTSSIRLWNANGTSASTVATGGLTSPSFVDPFWQWIGISDPVSLQNPFDFSSVVGFTSVNNSGQSAFSAITDGVGKLATPNGGTNVSGQRLFNETNLQTGIRPMIADTGQVVVRFGRNLGGNGVLPSPIRLFNNDLTLSETIASSAMGFTKLGQSPGISDDGRVVTFYGDLSANNSLGLAGGEGIFANIDTGSGRITQRIAGVAGNGILDPGETHLDITGNGIVEKGEDIGFTTKFDNSSRIGVNAIFGTNEARVVYLGSGNQGNQGIFVSDFKLNASQITFHKPIVAVGDDIGIAGTSINSLNIYDPVNNLGEVTFWTGLSNGTQAIAKTNTAELGIDRWWATTEIDDEISVIWTIGVEQEGSYTLDIDIENFFTQSWDLADDAKVTVSSTGFVGDFRFDGVANLGMLKKGIHRLEISGFKVPDAPVVEEIKFQLEGAETQELAALFVADHKDNYQNRNYQVNDQGNTFSLGYDGLIDYFAPILKFDNGESSQGSLLERHFLPLDVEKYSLPTGQESSWDKLVKPWNGIESLRNGDSKRAVDLGVFESGTPGRSASVIYASLLEDSLKNELAVNYYFHYPRSNWADHNGANTHEGDWEGVTLFLGLTNEGTWKPDRVAFGQHERFARGLTNETDGGQTIPWDYVSRDSSGGKPNVYVGLGGHASYPFPGQTTWAYGLVGTESHRGNFISVAPQVKYLPRVGEGPITEGGDAPEWLLFPGSWGKQNSGEAVAPEWIPIIGGKGDDGPAGPVFLAAGFDRGERWLDPWSWSKGFDRYKSNKVSLSIDDIRFIEKSDGSTNAIFTVYLSAASTELITSTYTTVDGSAVAGEDYTSTNGILTFAPGEISKTVEIPMIGDTKIETDETFFVNLSNQSTNASIADSQGIGTVINDDFPFLSVGNTTLLEGDNNTTNAVFTVTLSERFDQAVTVNYNTINESSTAGEDYSAATGSLTFAPGETSKTINISIIGDTQVEADQTFLVALSNPDKATINGTGQGIGTITNDDLPNLAISNTALAESDNGSNAVFAITLSDPFYQAVTVSYATANGSAIAGEDYTPMNRNLTFAPGETGKIINVPIIGDQFFEADEFFFVTLNSPTNAKISNAQGVGTIINDDILFIPTVAELSINNASVTEGNNNTTAAVLTVNLSQVSNQPVTVNYTTTDGSATSGSDYIPANGSLTFDVGEILKTINIQVLGDPLIESEETFSVSLSNPIGAVLGSQTIGTITITENDGLTLIDSSGSDTLEGSVGNDTITGGSGANTLIGGAGNDILDARSGRDGIWGGDGNDILIGGFGSDILNGGLGKDYFAYNSINDRSDRITDFQVGEDVLDLRNLFAGIGYQGNDPVADGYLQIVPSGSTSSFRIDIDGTFGSSAFKTLVTLDNVLPTSLTPNNYLFS